MDLPLDTSEGLEAEAPLVPLAARLAGAIEGPEAGVDGTLVGLGTQSVGVASSRLQAAIFPESLLAFISGG